MKDLPVLDSQVESLARKRHASHLRSGAVCRAAAGTVLQDVVPLSLGKHPPQPLHFEQFDHEDYEIALLPRGRKQLRTGTMSKGSEALDRILLLSLTWRELLNRFRNGVSDSNAGNEHLTLSFDKVRVDFANMEVIRSERPVALTAQEFRLLKFLAQNPRRVISRRELLNEVWGYKDYPSTRTVDNHVCTLRQKLEVDPGRPIHFLTVHRMGYKFVP